MNRDNEDKVIRYLRNLENRDFSSARSMCSDTATVWHNDGNGEQTIAENIASMQRQIPSIESMRYEVIRQISDRDAVLQQHVVHVATTNGMRGEVHAAVYFRFGGDLITRIEEYANFVPLDKDNSGN
ncbi:nuclear transport factor 2 family protein [Nocardia sp. NPDC004604]|uniref:nuclear transport factor 2 family protein n=1 Tax=Nocardia sp. NPDC004604 TaxID=3157013 RepID=UPI0033BAB083